MIITVSVSTGSRKRHLGLSVLTHRTQCFGKFLREHALYFTVFVLL